MNAEQITELFVESGETLLEILLHEECGFKTHNEIKRVVRAGAVKVDGVLVTDLNGVVTPNESGSLIQVGKNRKVLLLKSEPNQDAVRCGFKNGERPEDWQDQKFYTIDLGQEAFVLAFDRSQAEEAALKYWGWQHFPIKFVLDMDNKPETNEYPIGAFGPMGYLDASIMLEGDPLSDNPFRNSDGTSFKNRFDQMRKIS